MVIKMDEKQPYDEILYELSECRQDERDAQNQILQTLATAAAALTIILGVSIFGNAENFTSSTKNGLYTLCVVVLIAAIYYVISLGITNSIRYHYIRYLEDTLSTYYTNFQTSIVHWMSFNSAINTRNVKHMFNSKYTTISFIMYFFAIIFALLFCGGLTFIQYYVFKFDEPIILLIPLILISSAITVYIWVTVNAPNMYHFSYDHSLKKRNERINKMKNNNITSNNYHANTSNFVKGLLYFLYPAAKDFQKVVLVICGYIIGLLITYQTHINRIDFQNHLYKIVVVLVIIEALIYQARYQFNDIRGLKEDIATHIIFNKPGKYLVQCSNKNNCIILSIFIILIRLSIAFWLIFKISGEMRKPLLFCSFSIIFITIFYEISRTMKLDIPIIILVSFGYPLRILAGLWCAVPNLFENCTQLNSLECTPINIIFYLLSFAAMGGFSVTISWIYEAFYQKRSKNIIKHHYCYLFNSFEERYDKYIQKNEHRFFPLTEKGQLSDWWNFYFLIAISLLSLNISMFTNHNIILAFLECIFLSFIVFLCLSSGSDIVFALIISIICSVAKIIIIFMCNDLENTFVSFVLNLHQIAYLLLYYCLRCKFDPHFDFFKLIFILLIGKDTLQIIKNKKTKNNISKSKF